MQEALLLSGADGFTGKHFQRVAAQAGYRVLALRSDLRDADALMQEVAKQRPAVVVHLGAISAVTHADELAFYQVNLLGTRNLLTALRAQDDPPHKVVLASSANIYGNSPNSPIAEDAPPAPVNHYAMSKLAMEMMSREFSSDLPLVIARPFNYTGVGHDERFVVPKIVRHFRQRSARIELGNMNVEREFNDVRDVCNIYLRLLQQGAAGETYNICSGQTHSLQHVIDELTRLTGHSMQVDVNPDFVRANEVQRLCGCNAKLESCIGATAHRELADTLSWMLADTDS
tara:strand:- start:2794 stop:3654 length:861 start_codon:yes stop_codon:yes gene_type:complete